MSTSSTSSQEGSFAFLVHPRTRLAEDLGLVWPPLGAGPESVYDVALRHLPLPAVHLARVEIGGRQVGHTIFVPFGARHLLQHPVEGRRRVSRAVDRAVGMGVDILGLGGLTATVTAGGVSLQERTDIGVTNGKAFMASTVDVQARQLLDAVDPATGRHVAVVGATGSVGSAVAALLVRDRAVDRLTLVGRSRPRLTALESTLGPQVPTLATDELTAAAEADLVVLLTAAPSAVIGPEHLAPGAFVLDATQPRNTSPALLTHRPDVTVVDGGIVEIPSLRFVGGGLGLPRGHASACFAETALLALSGHEGHFAIGAATLEQVDHLRGLATDLGHLGFGTVSPTSFGEPVTIPWRAPRSLGAAG